MNNQVNDFNGEAIGTVQRIVDTSDGEMLLLERQERLGGGTIAMPMAAVNQHDKTGSWTLAYIALHSE